MLRLWTPTTLDLAFVFGGADEGTGGGGRLPVGVVTLVLLPLGVTGVVALDTDELVALPLLDVDVGSVDVGFLVTVGLAGLATLEACNE